MKTNINNIKLMEEIKKEVPLDKIYEQEPPVIPTHEATPESDKVPATGPQPTISVPSPKEEEPKLTPEIEKPEKQFFGSKGADIFYYLVRVKSEDGKSIIDLQIVDSNDILKFSAKENNLSIEDELSFVKEAIRQTDMDMISMDIVSAYDLLGVKKSEEEAAKERMEVAGVGTQPVPPQIEQPKIPGSQEEGIY